ncbi:2Fe-2S iron-sulfur cluster-binding protein [Spirosoma aerolatum]|uniref:2Fe-2S iron-sulfur cluster-binding protein n=1 Tax=Spirosoma aerolatum TaxID=1211326 RepID=UPI0009ACAEEA|nr:2Fe-2S iron-sulfur cluster-binding protein [Spirosoma aerolatum]
MTDDLLQLRIVRIISETDDTRSYILESVDGRSVDYQPGQFLTLLLTHRDRGTNTHEVRRSYSLSSIPGEPLQLTIKRVENGEISRYLHDTLRVGDALTSLHPAGRFTLDANQRGDLVLIGAGSGITPLFALLKQALYNEPGRRVTLLYSNSTERRIIFNEALAGLQQTFPERFRIFHLLSNPTDNWEGLRGRLNNVMLERLLPTLLGGSNPDTLRFYICGPGDYMRMVQFTLIFSGFQLSQIRRENFLVEPVVIAPPPIVAEDRTVLLRFHGREIEIQVPAYKSILQAALDEGVMLPYSCRGGRCSTCAAHCLSGRVHMTINDVLTDHDLADGWVLTCTGYPESDGVVIEV